MLIWIWWMMMLVRQLDRWDLADASKQLMVDAWNEEVGKCAISHR